MGILQRLLVLAVLMLACACAHAADAQCEQRLLASLDVEVDEDGTVLVPVRIGGREVWMALNMSQGVPMLEPAAVGFLGLNLVRMDDLDPEMTTGGKRVKQKVKVDHLFLGNADFTGWSLYVTPLTGQNKLTEFRGKPIVGWLSSNFMEVVDVELNLGARKMNLFRQTQCKAEAIYWGGEYTEVKLYRDMSGLLIFPVELDGKQIETSFNTASRYSRINSAVTSRFYGFDENSEGIEKETVGLNRTLLSYRAMGLSARGLSISRAKIQLIRHSSSCEATRSVQRSGGSRVQASRETGAIGYTGCISATPFSIGTDLLQKLRIYIATREGTIYITRAEAVAPHPVAESTTVPASTPPGN